jgi:hypothetical protein
MELLEKGVLGVGSWLSKDGGVSWFKELVLLLRVKERGLSIGLHRKLLDVGWEPQ